MTQIIMLSTLSIRKLILAAIIIGTALMHGCGKTDQIEGSVKDIFGSPLSEVSVSIENSGFKTKTNGSGFFGLDFASGQFVVRFEKEGFTSHLLELNLHQKENYPTGEVMLYPIPSQEGIFYVDQQRKELVALPLNSSVQKYPTPSTGLEIGITRIGVVRSTDELMPNFQEGELQFIDTDQIYNYLNKVRAEDFVISEAQYFLGSVQKTFYLNQPSEVITYVGPEKLILRSLKLDPGIYSWVPYGRNKMGNSIPIREKPAYTFSVNESDR